MIIGYCYSNEDNLRMVKWPEEFCCKPQVGDYISSLDRKHSRKIVRVEHFYRSYKSSDMPAMAYLGIELGK